MLAASEADEARGTLWEGNETVWHAWGPECDACGCAESSLKNQLLSCAGCLVAKYCTKECQRRDWKSGHKSQCHLYEANRKLSSVFAKSMGPGTVNDPKLKIVEKLAEWNFLNIHNHLVIASAALKNNEAMASTANIALLLSLDNARAGSKYEHRTFLIDRVLLLNRDASDASAKENTWHGGLGKVRTDRDHFKLMAGFCTLTGGETSPQQLWSFHCEDVTTHVLPPGFDLNRFIAHVNRGITHFHASFCPLPRDVMAELDVAATPVPPGWMDHARRHYAMLSELKGGQNIIGRIDADGKKTPVYKGGPGGHFRRRAPGETDSDMAPESKKELTDPSKMVQLMCRHLEIFEREQRAAI